jgi:hypothetical protein
MMIDMKSEITKLTVAFFSVSFLLFGSNIAMMSYAQPQGVPFQGAVLASQLQQQQSPQLQQQSPTSNATTFLPPIQRPPLSTITTPSPPRQHFSYEADPGKQCTINLNRFLNLKSADVGPIFPEWKPVNDPANRILAVLEGTVREAEVAFHDAPISHYTHDMTFKVRPDATPDNRYTNLLGVQIDPRTGQRSQQPIIEVEWETGLAAANSGNPFTPPNKAGQSGGFFSAGHQRGQMLSFWPTPGDRVHAEGLWVWDRGHPPALTEIHPPRLVATQRHLLSTVNPDPSKFALSWSTEIDVFASGDTGAYHNNRPGVPAFVQKVPMNIRDYTFSMNHIIPKPSPTSQLKWLVVKAPGDTFPGNPTITAIPGNPNSVRITIPWSSTGAPNTAVFARTIHLYWEGGGAVNGVAPTYKPNTYQVVLQNVKVNDDEDSIPFSDGEYRLFANVGSEWFFLNEIPRVSNILDEGVGDIEGGESFAINKPFLVSLPPGSETFRVHADGWEADGIDTVMGRLIDQNHACNSALASALNNIIFSYSVGYHGCRDDPVGIVNRVYSAATANAATGQVARAPSQGPVFTEDPCQVNTNPNNDYVLQYTISKINRVLTR